MHSSDKSMYLFKTILVLCVASCRVASGLQCWQCASVGGRKCPEAAETVDSTSHDACVTWRLGNGTVILQNAVRFEKECTADKVRFWTNFVAMFYSSPGSAVRCCDTDGCNTGHGLDNGGAFFESSPVAVESAFTGTDGIGSGDDFNQASFPSALPGAPMMFGGSPSPVGTLGGLSGMASPSPGRMDPITQQQQQLMAILSGGGVGLNNLGMLNNPMQQQFNFQHNSFANALAGMTRMGAGGGFNAFGNQMLGGVVSRNAGNCQRYFPSHGDDEWLPSPLVPLFYDRASGRRIGVFYAKFTAIPNNQDHIIVRLVGKDRSNRTMYTFKVGEETLALYTSTLELNSRGEYDEEEIRKANKANAVNLTDTSQYHGFWFTFTDDEITFGHMGDRLVDPVLIYNITRRDGPSDVAYFALTTEESQASFGINCEAPNLHFEDTCVEDDDCEDFANTVCSKQPVNKGLDPGARKKPFEEWKPKDIMLKSCFCREGHIRIPKSRGCYDPIREVVTLRDACFADYHCDHLPNTRCVADLEVPKYNKSCQCLPGYKAFDMDPRTGLVEGCAPLTKSDRSSVLACSERFEVEDDPQWVPRDIFPLERDQATGDFKYSVFFVKLQPSLGSRRDNVAVVRLLDSSRSSRKMLSVKFFQNSGKIAISESQRTRSFFFADNQRDQERATITRNDVMSRAERDHVGFWVRYRFEEDLGGVLSVGLNGDRFSEDAALLKWTDSNSNAIENMKYIGFTVGDGSTASFGASCVLADTSVPGSVATDGRTSNVGDVPLNQASALAGLNAFALGQTASNSFNANNPYLSQLTPSNQPPSYNQFSGLLGGGLSTDMLLALQQQQLLQQQQQQQTQVHLPGNNAFFQSSFPTSSSSFLGRTEDSSLDMTTGFGEDEKENDEVEEEEEEVIIEPVLRNKFLTKVRRMMDMFKDNDEVVVLDDEEENPDEDDLGLYQSE